MHRKHTSFTLVELMLVITIMGLLATGVAPVMKGFFARQKLPHAAKLFAATIRYCRGTAVHQSVRARLLFDADTGRLRMEAEESPLTGPGVFQEVPIPAHLQQTLDENVSEVQMKQMTATGPDDVDQLQFEPDGVVLGPEGRISDTFIYLRGEEESDVYTVAVVGVTGQVMIMNHEASTFYDLL